jgi:two-component system, sensor histidine kinase
MPLSLLKLGTINLMIDLTEENEHKQFLTIVCKDSGIGISNDSISRVFEEFFQESNVSDHRSNGSGLGLAITKTLIDLMGGVINICSEKGLGTTVTMKIPFELVTDDELIVEYNPNEELTLIAGKQILLVEDNKLNRLVFKMMLSNMKAEVDEAENGLEALDKLREATYDLVLMDIQMPVMDGTSALQVIKKKVRRIYPGYCTHCSCFQF